MDRLHELQHSEHKASDSRFYSVFIKFMRLFLPLAAIAIVMILLLWPQISSVKIEPLNESDLQALKQAESENRLLSPVFNTQDDKGRPMVITADEAIQMRSNQNHIDLVEPSASLKGEGGNVMISGNAGQYNQADKTISLQGGVVVSDSDHNVLETESLDANIAAGTAESQTPAKLTTKNGVVTGQKVIVEDNGQKTIFQGPAKAVITSTGSDSEE